MDLDEWLDSRSGVVRRAELLARGVGDAAIKRRVRSGEWQRAFRGVLVTHAATEDAPRIRCRAALVAAGRGAYLSCLGAAINRGLPVPADTPIHVSVPASRLVAHERGLVAHRNALSTAPSAYAGLPAVSVEDALIQSFGCLDDLRARRALVIESVRGGLVTTERVAAAIVPGTRRRPELLELLTICDGSQSEAEIAMLLLIRAALLPEPIRQYAVAAGGRRYRLDIAYPEVRLAIEVDGKAWHFTAERRTADIARDARLAADGWLTLRFTYEQLTTDADWVVRCISAALASRAKIV